MEIQQLKGFLSVATHKCFSVAARKTFRSQPAVSLQIKNLENELGVKLFDRISPRKLVLTNEGNILCKMLSPLIEDLESLPTRFSEACGNLQKGTVRIATHASVMTYLLPEVIKSFRKKYLEYGLSIVNRSREDIISIIRNGEADIGISSLQNVPKNINYNVFAKFRRILIANKRHPLTKTPSLGLKEIAMYPLIVPPSGSHTRTVIDNAFREKGLEYTIAMEITGREAIKSYINADLGISILNEYYLTDDDKKKFYIRDVSHLFGTAERGIISRKGSYQSLVIKDFIDMIFTYCK